MDVASLNVKVTNSGVDQTAKGLAAMKTEAAGAAAAVGTLEKASSKANATNSTLAGSVGNLAVSLRGLGLGYAGLQIIKAADDALMYEGRIRNATESIEEADHALAGLYETAGETGSLASAIEIFQRLSFVRKEIHATTDEMLQFTDSVQKLGVVSGASPDALKFGLTQLGQSLSSDIVRAEEFNSIMENIPAVGKQIADQFGITTGQLRRLVVDGKVLSADVFAAILNSQDEIEKKFDALPMTTGRAFSQLGVRIMEMVAGLNEASNATDILVGALDVVGDVLSMIVNIVEGFVYVFKGMFSGLVGEITASIVWAIEKVQDLINLGIKGINIFRKDDIKEVDFLGGVTSDNVSEAGSRQMGENFGKAGKHFKGAVEDVGSVFGIDSEEAKKTAGATREIATNYKKIAENLGDANKEAEKHAKLVAKTIDDLEFRNQQMTRSIADQELYNQLRQANVDIDSVAGQKIKDLTDEYQRLSEEQKVNKQIADGLGDSFSQFFKDATDGAHDFKDVMRNLVNDIQDMFYDLVVAAPFKKMLADVITGGSSGGGGGGILGGLGGIGGLLGGIGSIFGGGFTGMDVSGFATGGSFQVGGQGGTDSQLVAFRASPDETVSINRPDQMGQGGGVTYNIDARGADAGVEERMMAALTSLDRSLERRSINAVGTQLRRDPTFGRP